MPPTRRHRQPGDPDAATHRMMALEPTVITDADGSYQYAETQRMMALEPTVITDADGSYQYAGTQRMMALEPLP